MLKIKFLVTTIFMGVFLTTISPQAMKGENTKQSSYTNYNISNVNEINDGEDDFMDFKTILNRYYVTIKCYLKYFEETDKLSVNLYEYMEYKCGDIKRDIDKKNLYFCKVNIINDKDILKYYDKENEPKGKSIDDWIEKAKDIIRGYDDILKKWSDVKKSLEQHNFEMDNGPCNEVEKMIREIKVDLRNIKSKIEDIENDFHCKVSMAVFDLMDFKTILNRYYVTIKCYLKYFEETDKLSVNLYEYMEYKCGDIKRDIDKKNLYFCKVNIINDKDILKYYDKENEPKGKLIDDWIEKAKDIIIGYDDILKKWSDVKKSLEQHNFEMDNGPCNEVEKMIREIGKDIKNIKSKIEDIENDFHCKVSMAVFDLMDFKTILNRYYITIKCYLKYFEETEKLSVNLYEYMEYKCGDIKRDIDKKNLYFCKVNIINDKDILKYYDKENEPKGKLIDDWIEKAKDIIRGYDDILKKWSDVKKSLEQHNFEMDNGPCNEVEKMIREIGKDIKNIKSKIEDIGDDEDDLTILKKYYKIIKCYLEHFKHINKVMDEKFIHIVKENKNVSSFSFNMFPLKLCDNERGLIKKEIKEKFESCLDLDLLKCYYEEYEINEDLIKNWIKKTNSIIKNYDCFLGKYDNKMDNGSCNENEEMIREIAEDIKNIKLKIVDIECFLKKDTKE